MRSLFHLVVLKCVFILQIKQSCKSEKLVVIFSGGDRTRRGLVGLKYIPFDGLEEQGYVGAP